MTTIAEIKEKLKSGRPTIGSWMQIPSTDVAEIMGRAGYDWVAVDLEHGAFSRQVLPDIFRALELGGAVPMARIGRVEAKDIKAALDSGAMGLIFPMIESADQLACAISLALYPPAGFRGVGYSRANLFGKHFADYCVQANELVFVAQIEHINAVGALDEILSVAGLDAIMVGPYDLSGSMGITAQFDHPEFQATLEVIGNKAASHGIPMGLHVVQPDRELLARKLAEGYQFVAYAIDGVFLYNSCDCPAEPAGK